MRGTFSEFIAIAFFFPFTFSRLDTYLLIVLFKRSQVFTSFTELALLHPLTDIPVHKGTLRVHEVELVVDAREHLRNSGAVALHTDRAHHLRQVAARHHRGGLVVNAALEACGAPVHELDGPLRLDGRHRRVDV